MKKRANPTVFATRRGELIKRARLQYKILQADLAEELGVTRANLSMLESGKIAQITERQARVLIARLGLTWSELIEDPSMHGSLDDLAELTPQARRVARSWDKLPPAMQSYLWAQITAYTTLSEKQPVLAQIVAAASATTGDALVTRSSRVSPPPKGQPRE